MVFLCLLDTNFLFVPLQFGVDVYEAIPRVMEGKSRMILLSGVEDELADKIARGKGNLVSKHGKAALKLVNGKVKDNIVEKMEFDQIPGVPVDDYIIHAAKSIQDSPGKYNGVVANGIFIATNDKGLKKKALKAGLRVIVLRQKSQLMVE